MVTAGTGLQSRQHLQLYVLEVQVEGSQRSGVGAHGEMGDWTGAESSRYQAECCGMCFFLEEGPGRCPAGMTSKAWVCQYVLVIVRVL